MQPIDLRNVKTYPLAQRANQVRLRDLAALDTLPPGFDDPQLSEVAGRIAAARNLGRPVIWMMGAHVIKCGLSRLVIDLMQRGIITHIAGNGAVSIHDFELAMIGETSEDVPTSIEDGTFGMAEETGRWLNQAIQQGARDRLGYGAAVGRYITENPERFPHHALGILYNAYRLGIPATIHATIGADIIHQHPAVDFGAIGAASGLDFRLFTAAVSELETGVFLNFGSAVTGAEVFLKAITVARNLGHTVSHITTANFDLVSLGVDYHAKIGTADALYYYRPRKNIINRPTSLGGRGYHINGDHKVTIPNLYHQLVAALDGIEFPAPSQHSDGRSANASDNILRSLQERSPALASCLSDLARTCSALENCFRAGGTLFLCGNGGSLADALHISGELLKSYAARRSLPTTLRERLAAQEDGQILARSLEPGLRAVVLGANLALSSAAANDMPDRDTNLSQELLALAHPGDVLLGLSTSGNARNVAYAAQTARALGLTVIAFTGESGGRLSGLADINVRAPARRADRVQEYHVQLYHALCEKLEATFFSPSA